MYRHVPTFVFVFIFIALVVQLIVVQLSVLPLGFISGTAVPEGNTTVLNTPPVAVNLTSPADGASTGATPTFQWSESEDVNGHTVTYYLIIDDDSDFSSPILNITSLAVTNYTLTSGESLSPGVYYWRVDAFDSLDFNSSDSRSFTVTEVAPGAPSGGGAGPKKEINFTVEPEEISVRVFVNESKVVIIDITNTEDETTFKVKHNLDIFLNISEKKFELKKGGFKRLFIAVHGARTGVYTGEIVVEADGVKKKIPVLIEVETRNRYFDVFLQVPEWSMRINPGGDVFVNVNIEPLYEGEYNVKNLYGVKDYKGRLITSSEEEMMVKENKSFMRRLRLPVDIESKDYVAFVEVRYLDTVATSTDMFKVVPVAPTDYMIPGVFLLLILGLIIVSKRVIRLTREKKFVKYGRIKRFVEKRRLKRKLETLEKAWKAKAISRKTYIRTKKAIREKLKKL